MTLTYASRLVPLECAEVNQTGFRPSIESMTVAVKNDNKAPLVIPRAARRKAGFKSGQVLEIKASGGVITILPKLPSADNEYTPAQRRAIDAVLKESEAEFRERQGLGPFNSADEMITHMQAQLRKRAGARRTKRAR